MAGTNTPSIAAVVLNWNNYEDSAECVELLRPQLTDDDRVVVVDNGSTDDSLVRLRSVFPDVAYVVNDTNLGFAGGMNSGIEWAREEGYDTVLLLNNDVVVDEETKIHGLARKATEDGVGLVTPLVINHPGRDIWFARGEIDRRWITFNHETEIEETDRYLYNEYVPLCCSMISLSTLEAVGDLDEPYFLYCEDAELGEQLRASGYDLLTDTSARVHHKVSGSSESSFAPVPAYYRTRNRHRFYRNREDGCNPVSFVAYSLWWAVTRGAWAFATSGPDAAVALWRGELDGWFGRWGKGPY